MSNQCTFHYSIIMESHDEYPKVGSKLVEPVSVEDREPLGKEPDFCCENMKKALDDYSLYVRGFQGTIALLFRDNPNLPSVGICYCPFCGANIVFSENLKLRVCKTTRTIDNRYYEKYS